MHAPSKFATVSTALLLAMQAAALTVNSPSSLTTCQPALLSWTDGTGPYYPTIIPGGDPSGTPLKQFPQTNSDSLTWEVDLPAGTSITIQVTDSTGAINYSAPVTIRAGTDTSCVGGSSGGDVSATSDAAAPQGTTTTGTRRLTSQTTTNSPAASPSAVSNAQNESSGATQIASGLTALAGVAVLAVALL